MSSDDLEDWTRRLKTEWEERASSPMRDFFIASHRGWDDPGEWDAQARRDVEFATAQLDRVWLAGAEVLEIGCGVGRLVAHLRRLVASYTGVDIAPSLVDEARRRCDGIAGARFFECDGASIPAPARDREYDVVLVFAVFIHCPLAVIRDTLGAARDVLAPGGVLRCSLRADAGDHEGIIAPREHVERVAQNVDDTVEELEAAGVADLVDERAYTGHGFRYAEALVLLEELFGEHRIRLIRTDLFTIYADVTSKPPPRAPSAPRSP